MIPIIFLNYSHNGRSGGLVESSPEMLSVSDTDRCFNNLGGSNHQSLVRSLWVKLIGWDDFSCKTKLSSKPLPRIPRSNPLPLLLLRISWWWLSSVTLSRLGHIPLYKPFTPSTWTMVVNACLVEVYANRSPLIPFICIRLLTTSKG